LHIPVSPPVSELLLLLIGQNIHDTVVPLLSGFHNHLFSLLFSQVSVTADVLDALFSLHANLSDAFLLIG
jgi:hypothetical protein